MSQPTVTSIMKALEKELGFALIARSHKGVTLTKKGEVVFADALKILEMRQKWSALDEREADLGGDVHITVIPSLSPIVTQGVSDLKKEYPQINVIIHDGRKCNQIAILERQTAIIGLLGYLSEEKEAIYHFASQRKLVVRDLFTDDFCVYIGANHPLRLKKQVTKEDLKSLPVALYAGDDPVAPFFLKYFKQGEHYYMNSLNDMMTMAINNDVAAVCTRSYSCWNPLVQSGLIESLAVEGFELPFHYCLLHPPEQMATAPEKIVIEKLCRIFLDRA